MGQFSFVLSQHNGRGADAGNFIRGATRGCKDNICLSHMTGDVGDIGENLDVFERLQCFVFVVTKARDDGDGDPVLFTVVVDGFDDLTSVVVWINAAKRYEDIFHIFGYLLGRDIEKFVAKDEVVVPEIVVGKHRFFGIDGIDDEVGFACSRAQVLEIDNFIAVRFEGFDVVLFSIEPVVDNDVRVELFDIFKNIFVLLHENGVVFRSDFFVSEATFLVYQEGNAMVENVVGYQERVVYMAQSDGFVAGDDKKDMFTLEVIFAKVPIGIGIDIDLFSIGENKKVDMLSDAVLGSEYGATRDEECSGLGKSRCEILAVEPFFVIGEVFAVFFPPGEVGVVLGGDDGFNALIFQNAFDGSVQREGFEQRRGGLHGNNEVELFVFPLLGMFVACVDDRVESCGIFCQAFIPLV